MNRFESYGYVGVEHVMFVKITNRLTISLPVQLSKQASMQGMGMGGCQIPKKI